MSNSLKLPFLNTKITKPNQIQLPKLSFDQVQKSITAKTLPIIIGSLFFLSNPSDSNALSSGSRSGGSSFRSSSSMRSYSSPSTRSYSSPSSSRTYITPVMPLYNPIMPLYSPLSSPVIIAPSSGAFSPLTNLIILGGLGYALYNLIGGSLFNNFDASSESATVIKLNIAMNSDWGYDGIIPKITRIASNTGNLSYRTELSKLLSETSLALLRQSNDFIAVSHEAKTFNGQSQDVEPYFQRLAIRERSKFDKEVTSRNAIENGMTSISSSVTIVSLVVALKGKNNPSYKSVRSLTDTREVLQSLAADAMTDNGDNILAVEILWAPDSPNSVISERDLIIDYPELIKL